MTLDYGKNKDQDNDLKKKGVRLYLKVHVMPKLNTPLKGKAWYWIVPIVAIALGVFAFFYFFAN
ncbi:MAG: hypothetical protein PHE20_04385 [Patescibacteria group bacterium]|nr:hypothetical protein [Patescibacteria group bacterium]